LPILTCCQTTSVFYQNLNGCKEKSAVFSEKSGLFSPQRTLREWTGDKRPETTENRAKGPASFEA